MKLTIIRLQHFSEQDRNDIKKIWPQTETEVLEAQLDEQHQLYVARFNERLLAAVKVTLAGNSGQLSQLEVREVTRRRGVGLYLVEEALAQNPQIVNWSMARDGTSESAVIAAFMQAAGFVQIQGEWAYNSQQSI